MKRLLLIPLVLFLSCEDMGKDCAGEENGTAVLDECGVCNGDNSSCSGCTDSTASTYDSLAVVSDSSCVFLLNCNDGIDNDGNGLIDLEDVYNCIAGSGGLGEIPPALPEIDCNQDHVCPHIYSPVCGYNEVTYGNSCEAIACGIFVYTAGECQE